MRRSARHAARHALGATAAVTIVALVAGSCADGTGTTEPAAGSCAWQPAPVDGVQLTVSVGDQLLAVDADGTTACLAPAGGTSIRWSPGGERALVGDDVVVDAAGVRALERPAIAWADPDGATVLVGSDGGVATTGVAAAAAGTPVPALLDPLAPGAPAVLHPDGTHWVVGGTRDGQDGLWVVPTGGGEPRPLASGNDVAATEVVFAADAGRLWFAAVHGTESHLHVVDLVPVADPEGDLMIGTVADDVHPATGEPLGILPVAEHPLGISAVVAHPTDPAVVAYGAGACGDLRPYLLTLPDVDAEPEVLALGDGPAPAVPVGFLAGDDDTTTVVLALSADGCTGPWDLWAVDVRNGDVVDRRPLITGVDAAAVRTPPSTPAHTFVDVDITGFV